MIGTFCKIDRGSIIGLMLAEDIIARGAKVWGPDKVVVISNHHVPAADAEPRDRQDQCGRQDRSRTAPPHG
jgi:hypothetical protein